MVVSLIVCFYMYSEVVFDDMKNLLNVVFLSFDEIFDFY